MRISPRGCGAALACAGGRLRARTINTHFASWVQRSSSVRGWPRTCTNNKYVFVTWRSSVQQRMLQLFAIHVRQPCMWFGGCTLNTMIKERRYYPIKFKPNTHEHHYIAIITEIVEPKCIDAPRKVGLDNKRKLRERERERELVKPNPRWLN